jgi:hypothetical protein
MDVFASLEGLHDVDRAQVLGLRLALASNALP